MLHSLRQKLDTGPLSARLLLGEALILFIQRFCLVTLLGCGLIGHAAASLHKDVKQARVSVLMSEYEPSHRQQLQSRSDAYLKLAADQTGKKLSLRQAIAIAKRRHGGEVLSAKRATDGKGREIYVIKLLTDGGVVKKVRIVAN